MSSSQGYRVANGQMFSGGTFKDQSFGDGCIFEGCTIIAYCSFGKGCVFVNCSFQWAKHRPFSHVGDGAVLTSCTLDWVEFESAASLYNPTILSVSFGPDCVINTTARRVDGKATDVKYDGQDGKLGAQVANGEVSHDWCSYRCKPGRYVLGKAGSDVGVSGEDFGKAWSE